MFLMQDVQSSLIYAFGKKKSIAEVAFFRLGSFFFPPLLVHHPRGLLTHAHLNLQLFSSLPPHPQAEQK